jgi:hypothetical protein
MDKLREELTCPVCMDLLQNAVSLVPCQHIFCEACILPVLRQQQSKCPVCRATTEMLCQARLARNAASLVAPERPDEVQYQHVSASGLRMVPAASPLRPSGKRSAIYQIQFNLYPYDTLSFYGPEHTAELAEALAVNSTVTTALFCELGSMHARFVVAAMYANRCVGKLGCFSCVHGYVSFVAERRVYASFSARAIRGRGDVRQPVRGPLSPSTARKNLRRKKSTGASPSYPSATVRSTTATRWTSRTCCRPIAC